MSPRPRVRIATVHPAKSARQARFHRPSAVSSVGHLHPPAPGVSHPLWPSRRARASSAPGSSARCPRPAPALRPDQDLVEVTHGVTHDSRSPAAHLVLQAMFASSPDRTAARPGESAGRCMASKKPCEPLALGQLTRLPLVREPRQTAHEVVQTLTVCVACSTASDEVELCSVVADAACPSATGSMPCVRSHAADVLPRSLPSSANPSEDVW